MHDPAKPAPDHQSDDDQPNDAVVQLLEQFLLRAQTEGSGVLDELCQRHPEHAAALREGVRFLRREAFVPDVDSAPEQLGEYRLLHRLGGGGMGEVFLAEQTTLGRRVALKLIRPELLYFAGNRARFQREAEAIARLQHPGIVPVHAAGDAAGVPFFAMDYVEGASLAAVLAELTGRQPEQLGAEDLAAALRRAAHADTVVLPFRGRWWQIVGAIVLQIAQAVEHAHQRGVLHRDLKPSNVMLGNDGRVQLVDFGLARSEGDVAITNTGTPLGSLAYMSPEQVLGNGETDVRTDIYGLGVTLYELLTLRCPFLASSSETTRARILEAKVLSPRQLLRSLPRDLEVVCLQAMAPEPERRYACMADFVQDLGSALVHKPIAARRAGPWLRLTRYARRHPARLALAVVMLVTMPTVALLLRTQLQNRTTVALGLDAERASRKAELLLTGWADYQTAPRSAQQAFDAVLALDANEPLAVLGSCLVAMASDRAAVLDVLATHDAVVRRHPMFDLVRQMTTFDTTSPFALPADAEIPAAAIDWFLVGIAAMQRADLGDGDARQRAVSCFDQAILLSSTAEAVFHMRRCEALVAGGERQRARQAVQVLTARWPESPGVLAFAGGALIGADPARAQQLLDRALELDPSNARAFAQLGRIRFIQGDKPGYLAAERRAAELLPDHAEIQKNLAIALSAVGELPAARTAIEAALRLDPGDPEAHVVHGDILGRLGHLDEAFLAWAEAERMAPALPLTYYTRAQALIGAGRHADAVADLRKAIARDPDNPAIHGSLAIANRRRQDWAGARAAATEAVRLAPGYSYWRLELAVAQWRLGDVALAKDNIRRVVLAMPRDDDAHEVRVRLAIETGDEALRTEEEARWRQVQQQR